MKSKENASNDGKSNENNINALQKGSHRKIHMANLLGTHECSQWKKVTTTRAELAMECLKNSRSVCFFVASVKHAKAHFVEKS